MTHILYKIERSFEQENTSGIEEILSCVAFVAGIFSALTWLWL